MDELTNVSNGNIVALEHSDLMNIEGGLPGWFGKAWGVIASTVTLAGYIVIGAPVLVTAGVTGAVVGASILVNMDEKLPVEKK